MSMTRMGGVPPIWRLLMMTTSSNGAPAVTEIDIMTEIETEAETAMTDTEKKIADKVLRQMF